ncbi:MAG: sigma-70 family RNA polymerase sigma factor [Pseudomonadales bacterium]
MAETSAADAATASVDRGALVRLAYRLLGTVEDAEDVVQEAHVRLLSARQAPDDAGAYLFRVVTNLAIDRLRHLRVQRRAYPGPWLPEPLPTADEPDADLDRADDLDTALLVLLERLSVTERVAFVLREACDLDFGEMAEVLGARADACRQRYHRARRKLDGLRRPPTPSRQQRRLLERLKAAVMAGDRDRLTALLADDAVLLTDGGGRVSAAIRPVEEAVRIAQVLLHLAARQALAEVTFEWRALNGGVGLLIREQGAAFACVQLAGDRDGERIERLFVVRNPDKLGRLVAP